MAGRNTPIAGRIKQSQEVTGVDKLLVSEEDININNDNNNDIEKDKENNNDIDINNDTDIDKDSNNDNKNNIDNDNNKDIDIDTQKDIKKYIKPKAKPPVGYHCRLPEEYVKAIDKAKKMTGFYKDELAQMAYDLLFKELGIKVKK